MTVLRIVTKTNVMDSFVTIQNHYKWLFWTVTKCIFCASVCSSTMNFNLLHLYSSSSLYETLTEGCRICLHPFIRDVIFLLLSIFHNVFCPPPSHCSIFLKSWFTVLLMSLYILNLIIQFDETLTLNSNLSGSLFSLTLSINRWRKST